MHMTQHGPEDNLMNGKMMGDDDLCFWTMLDHWPPNIHQTCSWRQIAKNPSMVIFLNHLSMAQMLLTLSPITMAKLVTLITSFKHL